ncbi:hypothetical protein [Pontibacter vulgaris]|uniref:hypothetical protein n=1 Tax=Pontibacter vulgaris TaxID=2905679 RepID=UPI001FA76B4B|nr:hypothetical protein [Pontibacter vulgaris]
MKALFYPLFCMFLLVAATSQAQQPAQKGTTAPSTLSTQFNNLKANANSYREKNQEYKVINVRTLNAFWDNVQQTIKETEQGILKGQKSAMLELAEARKTIQEQNTQLQQLKQENAQKDQQVKQSLHDVNSLTVLGMDMQKQFYVLLTAGIILALIIALAVVLLQYKSSKRIATEKQSAYNEIDQELNEYKKSARERELKIKRDLQTEMNRIEELNQELARLRKNPQV